MYSSKKGSVYLQNFTDYKPALLTPSQNRCTCGNCQILGRVEACICCHEIEAVQNKNIEAVTSGECEEQPRCITQHPGFHPVCINRWVLQVAWYQYKQQYKAAYDGREDKLFRHIAYRQLTRWCWGILGKEIRVVLPACAVMCIRNFYPPPGPEEDFVFEGFHYADEWLFAGPSNQYQTLLAYKIKTLNSFLVPMYMHFKWIVPSQTCTTCTINTLT